MIEKIEVKYRRYKPRYMETYIKLMWKGFSRLGKNFNKQVISNSYVILNKQSKRLLRTKLLTF